MDRLFGLDHAANEEGLSLAGSFFDPVSASIAGELLDAADIPYLKKERGAGSMVRLVAGFQSFGTDFFVRSADLDRATQALLPLTESGEGTENEAQQ